MDHITLSDGRQMPAAGFGVFRIAEGAATVSTVAEAIKAGYRHFDTAQGYWNEAEVGQAIAESGLARSEFFITTKIWMYYYRDEDFAYESIVRSARKLGGFIDLCLLHQAVGDYYAVWRAMIRAQREGLIGSLGVSNFTAERLTDLCLYAPVPPTVNQIGINPLRQMTEMDAVHRKYNIVAEAYSPLRNGDPNILQNPVLCAIAHTHGRSVSQIVLRWLLQRGIVPIVKSTHRARMEENLAIFDFALSKDEMDAIAALGTQAADTADLQRAETAEMLKWVVEKHADKYEA